MRNSKGQFVKGITPWNKGLKGSREAWNKGLTNVTGHHPNTRKTQFKKGFTPHNHRPIGSERESDGYLYRKVSDNRNPPKADWKMVHVLLWEEHHGKVPKKHTVVFKDGNRKNITIDNLELVSRAELMRRNSIMRFPKELRQVIRLNHKLRRTLNEKSE